MRDFLRNRIRLVLVFAVVAAIAAELAIALVASHSASTAKPDRTSQPVPLEAGTLIDKPLGRLPLIDEHGRPTSLAAFHGKYLVLAPSLTLCHEVCPLTTGALMRLKQKLHQAGLDDRVVVAEATVDPWRDSPARIRAFKRRTGTDIRFLTGTKAQIKRLWKALGVEYHRVAQGDPPDEDWWTHRPEKFDVTHTDGVFVIDPDGHWRIAVPGMPITAGKLSSKLASLLNDEGRDNLRKPDTPWTVDALFDDVQRLMGRKPAPPSSTEPKPPSPAEAKAKLAGSPRALAGLHAQAGQLLGGGKPAFQARLAALRGHPVVVNEWASWCPPCREELPLFAAASARYGKRVAFVGLNVNDAADSARRFLSEHPVSYPSYSDDGGKAAAALASSVGLPTTVFIDASGKVTSVHTGQYADAAALTRDVERYALGQGT